MIKNIIEFNKVYLYEFDMLVLLKQQKILQIKTYEY